MYFAKREGRNRYQFFTEAMNAAALKRLTMESLLRQALERGELSLHYQPQMDVASGTLSGMEALLRWNSAELGSVPPAEFIPLAEETGPHRPDRRVGAAHRLRPGEGVARRREAPAAGGGQRLGAPVRPGPISRRWSSASCRRPGSSRRPWSSRSPRAC